MVLGLCSLAGRILAGRILGGATGTATAAIVFLPLWLAGAGINMYFGVKRAGYSIADETSIFLVVFIVPAEAALVLW